jgi:hypothetical protein
LTGNAATGVEALSAQWDHREELDGLLDHELLRRAARETLIAVNLVCLAIQRQVAALVVTKTSKQGHCWPPLLRCSGPATDSFAQANCIRHKDGWVVGQRRMRDYNRF